MHTPRRILLAALPLFGCSGAPVDPASDEESSGGPGGTSSSGRETTSSEPTSGGPTSGEPTSGEPTSGGSTGGSTTGAGEDTSSGGATTGDDGDTSTGASAEPAPDFMLIDVNPNSATYQQPVSPRDYLERVSGWYFAHAT